MNIELIKSEIAKLSQLVASWEGEAEISSIERDLALDKLKDLYDLVRFDTATIEPSDPIAAAVATSVAVASNEEEHTEEQEVEVEFLFTEEDDEQEDSNDDGPAIDYESGQEDNPNEINEAVSEAQVEQTESESETKTEAEVETETEAEVETEAEIEAEVNTETETQAQEQAMANDVQAEPAITEEPAQSVATQHATTATFTGNLFGMEEPKRHTRSKHLRMMSIYNDANNEHQQTKRVDVSKIFDFEVNMEESNTSPAMESQSDEDIATSPTATPRPINDSEKSTILADTIAANKQTLADTISTPAPLAEEITNSKISSLMEGVGINDKFLMIRDLFDGDDEAYATAIRDLDAEETFEDCMIYIVEHFEWNPDSEGAKFMMKLLERKHA